MRREELKLVINLSSDKFGKHDTQTLNSYFASGENKKGLEFHGICPGAIKILQLPDRSSFASIPARNCPHSSARKRALYCQRILIENHAAAT
jgi:hypothetical protein